MITTTVAAPTGAVLTSIRPSLMRSAMKKSVLIAILVAGIAGVAWAHSPDRREMERVRETAHSLEKAARHVHESAGRLDDGALHDLENTARHFHRQVERYRRDPAHTEADFQNLVDAYYSALDEMRHMDRHVRNDFRDVERYMQELMVYYGGREDWVDRYRR
jgi:hypothetical protein